jgi:hypothetical protein
MSDKELLTFGSEKEKNVMKINRFVALAVIALLVVGTMGAISMKVFARSSNAPAAQTQPCDQEDDDNAEVQETADTDDIEEQCGDQNAPDEQEAVNDADTDTTEAQEGDQNEVAEQEANATEAEDAEDAVVVPAGVTVITPELADRTGRRGWSIDLHR